MKLSVLASSSSGNSIYLEHNNFKCLVDAGLTGKKITENLAQIERDIKDINAIFVTHEHSDHIQGLGVISRKYDIPIYLHEITYGMIREKIGKIDPKNINFLREDKVSFEECTVNNFEVMHDAEKCLGFTFEYDNKKAFFDNRRDTKYIRNSS